MRYDWIRLVATAALFTAACSGSNPGEGAGEAPKPTGVVPGVGYPTAAMAIEIDGDGFLVKATRSSGGGTPTIDTRHRAWLGDAELSDVAWVSTTKLTAKVPAGLPVGAQKLTVENAIGGRGVLDAAFTVLEAPPFSATIAASRARVNVGQEFTLTFTVANARTADVVDFALGTPVPSSTDGAQVTLVSGPTPSAPATLAAGSSQSFTWTYSATAAGTLTATVSATGKDDLSGETLTATPPAAAQIAVQAPAALAATWDASQTLQTVNQPVTVTLRLANAAGSASANVTGVDPSAGPSTDADCTAAAPSATEAAPIQVAEGTYQDFSWTCTASVHGTYTFNAAVTATDANTSESVVTGGLTGVAVTFTQGLVVAVDVHGSGSGTISSDPAGIDACSALAPSRCSAPFTSGTRIVLTATPGAGSTVTWAGCDSSTSATCTIQSLASARTIDATFTLATYPVTVTVNGTGGGTVASSPAGISSCSSSGGDCSQNFNHGTPVTLTATPAAGSSVSWSGCDSSSGNTCTLSALTAARSVTATFRGTAATPTFSPTPGAYGPAQSVTISDTTLGAVIHYTINGGTPTAASATYTVPISVTTTTTIRAIAIATGYTNSAIASATYTINGPAATPTFSPAAGTYTAAQSVTISSDTPGAVIHYTINGSDPTSASDTYTVPISVTTTTTIRAIAIATGYTNSAIASATYTITASGGN
jgi:hypothetical protein